MNAVVVAATVTVYFIGLVNFQTTGTGRKVILPLANVPRAHQTELLEAHEASIEITHLGKSECDKLGPGQTWTAADTTRTPPTPSLCVVSGLSGAGVTLPTTGTSFRTTMEFDKIPKLRTLCPAITRMRPRFETTDYAVKLTLDSGELDAYQAGSAWVSRIALTSTPAKLVMSRGTTNKEVELSEGAVVRLRNEPKSGTSGTDEQHFWWYYVMAENSCDCENIPAGAASSLHAHSANRGLPEFDPDSWPAASGPGCSNTNFP